MKIQKIMLILTLLLGSVPSFGQNGGGQVPQGGGGNVSCTGTPSQYYYCDGGTGAWAAISSVPQIANLGTAANQNIGTSGSTVPLLNGTNTWAAVQTFSSTPVSIFGYSAPNGASFFLSNNTNGGRVTLSNSVTLLNNLATFDPALIVNLANASSTANIENWQKQGTTVGGITNGGNLFTPLLTPASSSATCTTGTAAWDANFIYICTATNTWKRSALSAF